MSDPPEEESSSAAQRVGFYESFHGNTPTQPTFLQQSSSTQLNSLPEESKKQNDATPLPLNSSNYTSVSSSSTFGSIKRKRKEDVVSVPSFKVSAFVSAPPHLPKFGTSLTKAKFNFTSSSRSTFYSGRTKFGGSSSLREQEECTKRIKISPVSQGVRTNVTSVSAKPYVGENRRTLTSKTAENILKTLNKICSPAKPVENFHSEFSSSFSSFSKRLREKKKNQASLPQPPIQRLNQVQLMKVRNPKVKYAISKESDIVQNTSEDEPAVVEKSLQNIQANDTSQSTLTKNGLKMKKQRTGTHYTREKSEEPINAIPEVTDVKPLIVSSLPKFQLAVKPARKPIRSVEAARKPIRSVEAAKCVQPVRELVKPDLQKIATSQLDAGFEFRAPKCIGNADKNTNSLHTKYSFISPLAVIKSNIDAPEQISKVSYLDGTLETPKLLKEVVMKSRCCNVAVSVGGVPFPSSFVSKAEVGSWECPMCMITNKVDQEKCAACTHLKPGDSSEIEKNKPFLQAAKSDFSFGTKTGDGFSSASSSTASPLTFSKPVTTGLSFGKTSETAFKSSAKDSTLFSFTQPSSTVSVGRVNVAKSTATNTQHVFAKPAEVSGKLSNTQSNPNPFNLNRAAEGSWDCPTCMIVNKPHCEKCEACTEPKPGSEEKKSSIAFVNSSKAELKFGGDSASESSSTFSFGAKQTTGSGFSFGTSSNVNSSGFSFGKTLGNASSAGLSSEKSSNTSIAQTLATLPNPFEKFKPAEGSWSCPTCMVNNDSDAMKCVACEENKPASTTTQAPSQFSSHSRSTSASLTFGSKTTTSEGFSFKTAAASSNPFLNLKKPEEGSWECPTCMINNKPDCLKCAACSEPKPGEETATVASFAPPTQSNSDITFGQASNASSASSGFSFVPPVTTAASSGFSFGSAESTASSGFSFAAAESTASSGFSFVPPATASAASSGFSFAPPATTAPAASSGFSFVPAESTATSGFSFAAAESTASSGFSFVPPATTAPAASSGFSFAPPIASVSSTEIAASSFGVAVSNGSGFSFSNLVNSNGGFSFADAANNSASEQKVTPIFNNNKNVSDDHKLLNGPTSQFNTASSGFNFGTVNKNENPSLSKTVSGGIFNSVQSFETPKINGVPSSESNTSTPFNFSASTSASSVPTFMFSDAKPSEPPAKFNFNAPPSFNFGGATNAGAVFGNPNPNGQFNFATNSVVDSKKSEAPKVNIFAQAPAGNLFTIGGSGGAPANPPQANFPLERRKVKRAHRRLAKK